MSTRIQIGKVPGAWRESGAAAVEFAIVLILMLLILAGIVGFGRAFWHYDALTKATRDGARLMSSWPKATIVSEGVPAAQDLVVNTANAANLSPALTDAEVSVTCLDGSFGAVACTDGTAPANVRVAITGYSITIGSLMPFITTAGADTYAGTGLSPHTVMRYMN